MTGKQTKYQSNKVQASHRQPKIKVAVGMSGGVDSSLAAHLLVEQGYDVTGVFLECWRAPGCRSDEDRKDALEVALGLNVPFKVLDFKAAYRQQVVENFFAEYEAGRTPNPDVLCNKEIKFGLFYDWAMSEGFDYIATGHYAKKVAIEAQNFLAIPADHAKDQTYFMHLITQNQLDHTIFPLQELNKNQVRTEAKKRKIHVAEKKDSVGICFIGDINVHDFLEERLGKNPGEVVDTQGNVIGAHQGLWFYTVGQRSGFTVNQTSLVKHTDGSTITKHNIPPFYVIGKDAEKNQLVVGFGSKTFRDEFSISGLHLIDPKSSSVLREERLKVRIRHTGELIPCQVEGNSKVILEKPTKGIAAGQSAVFYQQTGNEIICLGGGVIEFGIEDLHA